LRFGSDDCHKFLDKGKIKESDERTDNRGMEKTALIANRKGFTLIELMAVMVIMGVMVSVAYQEV